MEEKDGRRASVSYVAAGLKRSILVTGMLAATQATASESGPLQLTDIPFENLLAMEVYSASRFRQNVSDAPSAVSVVTAADIKTYGWRTLADILRSLPGLYVRNDRNYSYLGARGFQRLGDYSSRFLLLLDGNRTSDVIYDQAKIGSEFVLDIDLIERVEYVPGPGSSIYGANAFFGVINVITKSARDAKGGQVSFEAGSHGAAKGRASIGWQHESGAEVLFSATGFDSSGQDLAFPEYASPSNNRGVAKGLDYDRGRQLFLKASAGPFNLSVAHSERKKGIPTASFWQVFNDARSYTLDTQTFVDLGYQQALSADSEVTARLFSSRYEYIGNLVYDVAKPTVNRDIGSAQWWGGDFKLVTTRIDGHKLVAGLEYQRNAKVDQINFDLDAAPLRIDSRRGGNQAATRLDSRNSGNQLGLFVQDEIALGKALLLSMGLRYDRNSTIRDGLNPRLGLIYKVAPGTIVKALYGKAYRAPNAYELYHQIPGADGQKANPLLQAEHIETWEMVLEHQLSPSSNLRLSTYRNSVSDLITQTLDPADGLLAYRNTGKATSLGLEAGLETAWSGGARLRASYAWQQARNDETGQSLVNTPRHLLKTNLSLPMPDNRWRAGLETSYVSRRDTLAGGVAGYWLANLTMFSDRLFKNLEISASIYNLFDRRYADPGGPEHLQNALSQDGRNLRVKLVYGF